MNMKIYNTAHSYLQVSKLPAGVTKSVIKVTTDPANFHGKVATSPLKTVFDEKILTIDSKGKVTMTRYTPPCLCKITTHTDTKKWIQQRKYRFIQKWNFLRKYHVTQKHL